MSANILQKLQIPLFFTKKGTFNKKIDLLTCINMPKCMHFKASEGLLESHLKTSKYAQSGPGPGGPQSGTPGLPQKDNFT